MSTKESTSMGLKAEKKWRKISGKGQEELDSKVQQLQRKLKDAVGQRKERRKAQPTGRQEGGIVGFASPEESIEGINQIRAVDSASGSGSWAIGGGEPEGISLGLPIMGKLLRKTNQTREGNSVHLEGNLATQAQTRGGSKRRGTGDKGRRRANGV